MPPRIPFLSAFKQPASSAFFRSQACQFSQQAPLQAIRQNVPSSPASSMLNLDSSNSKRGGTGATEGVSDLFTKFTAKHRTQTPEGERRVQVLGDLKGKNVSEDYMRQMPRRWREGELYAPHDLSEVEAAKWRKMTNVQRDLVDMLGLRPLDMYSNFSVVSEYMTPHGRIRKRIQTGLTPKNQRKIAKMVRRSVALGIHPSVHRHPELLMRSGHMTPQQSQAIGKWGHFV
ncbi:mitochondrial 37S ribosomal protein bS18m [Apiospora aurea]|uniref:Small ribosomal subunit protein bS18m n=1 Tax=Apiospora aurea TaxID=335848 RepID=A0ABR1QE84_9PEZI